MIKASKEKLQKITENSFYHKDVIRFIKAPAIYRLLQKDGVTIADDIVTAITKENNTFVETTYLTTFFEGLAQSSQKTITEAHSVPTHYNNYNLTASTRAIPGNGILDGKFSAISLDNDSIYQANVSVNIYQSKTDSARLVIIKHTNGESKKGAITKARNINYAFTITDSTINLNNYLSTIKIDKIRGQRVKVKLYLPEGKSVYLDESITELVYDIPNVTNTWDRDMLNKKWVMSKDGLMCLDCKDIEGMTSDELMIRYPNLYNSEIE